ncbi:MAG: nucleotidyltransferase family protein [Agathobacter sp.]|nr:nucleotidyltransferase family protein [Agathobacter sp.]
MLKQNLMIFIALNTITVVEAMEKIDKNGKGILFIVDNGMRLVGCVTDGDIRRWIIKTGRLDVNVDIFMNKNPKVIFNGNNENAFSLIKEDGIKAMPVLDFKRRVIDIIFENNAPSEQKNHSTSLENTNVIIMAGGKGTRLYPYTKILPKPLIPIGEVPILERIINKFCEYGISNYYLTVNYKKAMIKSYFADFCHEYVINYVEEDKPLGTAGSIKLIRDKFEDPVIITNCDTLVDVDYKKVMEYHISSENALTIVAALKNVIVPYGVIHSGSGGVIQSMEEKPKKSYFINTGLYVLNPELIQKIPDDCIFHMTNLADLLMKENYQVGMYPISEDAFLDMGEFEEMSRMEKKLNLE